MKNFDGSEVIPLALDFIERANDADEPFFVWLNTSRMHLLKRIEDECLRKVVFAFPFFRQEGTRFES